MKHSQVVNLLEDSVLAFNGDDVIDDTDQETLGDEKSILSTQVDINFFDITTGLAVAEIEDAEMVYNAPSNYWTVLINGEGTPDIFSSLEDRHKYVGRVSSAAAGGGNNLRSFSINEFSVDNDSFEGVLMRYPFEIDVSGGEAWIRWYGQGDIGGTVLYQAPAYEGGTGTTYATSPDRVTHRGEIIPAPGVPA